MWNFSGTFQNHITLSLGTLLFFTFFFDAGHSLLASQTIQGQLVDEERDVYIDFANVSLLNTADSSLVTGATTDFEGRFSLQAGPGEYLLRVSFLGYETHWDRITVESGDKDLGKIPMREAGEMLTEVSVEAAALMFRSDIDKRVYDVENTIAASGGSAIQLLETLPSIQVDDEGQINLRGSSNLLIYINGQPTNLTADDTESVLEQFPANAIKSVEVITNPSARYDAEGVGGIINIILNESDLQGFNGQISLGVGTGHKYNGGVNLNYRTNGFNFSLGYNYQYRERWEFSESYRESFTGQVSPILDQEYNTTNWDQSHLIRPGIEYRFNDYSSINLTSSINARSRDRERLYEIRSLNTEGQQDSAYFRLLEEDQSRVNLDLGVNFRRPLAEKTTNSVLRPDTAMPTRIALSILIRNSGIRTISLWLKKGNCKLTKDRSITMFTFFSSIFHGHWETLL
jgi:iron complex outermembrane recepter protein